MSTTFLTYSHPVLLDSTDGYTQSWLYGEKCVELKLRVSSKKMVASRGVLECITAQAYLFLDFLHTFCAHVPDTAQFPAACVNESAERKDAASGQAVVGSGGKVKFLDGHVQ